MWRLAFGKGEIPTGPLDSCHNYVKSKVRRCCTWFSLESTEPEVLIFSQASGSVDHLMMVLQRLDAEGSTLSRAIVDNL